MDFKSKLPPISLHKSINSSLIIAILYMNFTGYSTLSIPLAVCLVLAEIAITKSLSTTLTNEHLSKTAAFLVTIAAITLWVMCAIGIYKNIMETYYQNTKPYFKVINNQTDSSYRIKSLNIKIADEVKKKNKDLLNISEIETSLTKIIKEVNKVIMSVPDCSKSGDCSYRRDTLNVLKDNYTNKLSDLRTALEDREELILELENTLIKVQNNRVENNKLVIESNNKLEDSYGIFKIIFNSSSITKGYQIYVGIISTILYFLYLVSLFIEKRYKPLTDKEKEVLLEERLKKARKPEEKEVIKYVDKLVDNYILVAEEDTAQDIQNKIKQSKGVNNEG